MSKSEKLSERHTRDGGGKSINTSDSRKQESDVVKAINQTLAELRSRYPEGVFDHEKSQMCSGYRSPENEKSYFSPDGGFIYQLLPNGKKVFLVVMEAKKQGTNKIRIAKGLPKQSKGNAIERAHKNASECNWLFLQNGQKSFPYLLICSGSDFETDSTIRDRVGSMCGIDPMNKLYCDRTADNQYRATVLIREDHWSVDEIVHNALLVCEKVMQIDSHLFNTGS